MNLDKGVCSQHWSTYFYALFVSVNRLRGKKLNSLRFYSFSNNMPLKTFTDPEGHSVDYHEYKNMRFPPVPFHDLDISLSQIRDLQCRDDDVTVLSYPKTGTHWVCEMTYFLTWGLNADTHMAKAFGMLEVNPIEALNKLPSPRCLNTHFKPDMVPKELFSRKTKLVYLDRNPKDVFVSFYNHTKGFKFYKSTHTWDSFFNHCLEGKVDFGSWFEYTKSWENFFVEHPEVSVLRLNYEDLKLDFALGLDRLIEFLGKSISDIDRKQIINRCDFTNMQKDRPLSERMKAMVEGDKHPIFRKGIIGDWKNQFTVAQNERFDAIYKQEMAGYNLSFEKYM